jgi:hypothetical protein
MLTFKEYLEFSEFSDLENDISEGLLSTLGGITDAGISGVGTFGKQIVRGLGNTVWGGAKTAASGIGSVIGSPESRKQSKKELGSNLRQTARGVTQALTSPVAGLWRGVEAGRNPFSDMKSGGADGWGEMFGVRGEYKPSWDELISKLDSTKDKNERIKIISQMKKFYSNEYEKEREKREKLDSTYIISKVPGSDFISRYIEGIYNAHKQGKKLVLNDEKPEVFIKKLWIAYLNSREKNQDLDMKLTTILKEYFSQIRIKKLSTPEDLNIDLTKSNVSRISNYIHGVYISAKREDEIILPKNIESFVKSLIFIRDNIFSDDGFNKNLHQKLAGFRNQINEIINIYQTSGNTAPNTAPQTRRSAAAAT